jgi:hypothetical protein
MTVAEERKVGAPVPGHPPIKALAEQSPRRRAAVCGTAGEHRFANQGETMVDQNFRRTPTR